MTAEVLARRPETSTLSSLREVRDFLYKRQPAFYATFLRVVTNSGSIKGWEIVETLPSGPVVKRNKRGDISDTSLPPKQGAFPRRPEAIFTGNSYCDTVSTALYDCLLPVVDTSRLALAVEWIGTDMMRENWSHPDYTLTGSPDNHTIVRVTDTLTREGILADGMYGQVDHTYAGRMLIIPEASFSEYYRLGSGQEPKFVTLSESDLQQRREGSQSLTTAELAEIRASLLVT